MTQRRSRGALPRNVLALAIVALMVAPAFHYLARAQVGGPEYDPAGSEWGGPWNPDVTSEQTNNFVLTFYRMLTTPDVSTDPANPVSPYNSQFDRYLNEPGIPAEISGLAVMDKDVHTKKYLVNELYKILLDSVLTSKLPTDPVERQQRMDDMRVLLYTMIFEKDDWRTRLQEAGARHDALTPETPEFDNALDAILEDLRAEAPPSEMPSPPVDPELAPPAVVIENAADLHAAAMAARLALFDGEEAYNPVLDTVTGEPGASELPTVLYSGTETLGDIASTPDFGVDAGLAAPEVVYSGTYASPSPAEFAPLDPAPAMPAPLVLYDGTTSASATVTLPGTTAVVPLPGIDVSFLPTGEFVPLFAPQTAGAESPLPAEVDDLHARARNTIDSTTWSFCGAKGAAFKCAPAAPVNGDPIPLDIDNDGATDATGKFETWVNVNFPAGYSYRLTVTAAGSKSHVFAIHEIPGTAYRFTTGFDGTVSGLGTSSVFEGTLKDVSAAATRDVKLLVKTTFSGASGEQAVTFSAREVRPDTTCPTCQLNVVESNILAGSIRIASPTTLTVDMRYWWQSGVNTYTLAATPTQAVKTTVDLAYWDTPTGALSFHHLLVDVLPTTATISLIDRASDGSTEVQYDGGAAISRLFYELKHYPSWASSQDHKLYQLDAADVPTSVRITVKGQIDFTYASSTKLTSAKLLYADVKNHAQATRIDAAFADVPKSIHVVATASSTSASLVWDADTVAQTLTLSYKSTEGSGMVGNLAVTGVPKHVDVTLQSGRRVAVNTDIAITTMTGDFSTAGTPVQTLTGDYASLNVVGSNIGIGFRVNGFRGLLLDQTTANKLTAEVRIQGDQAFQAWVQTAEVKANLFVSNMPDRVTMTFEGGRMTYDATQAVNKVTAHVEVPGAQLVADVEVTGIPLAFTLAWSGGPAGFLTYTAGAATTGFNARVRKGASGGSLDGRVVLATIPTSVSVTYDTSASAAGLVANGHIGTLSAQLLVDDAAAPAAALPAVPTTGDHVSVGKTGGDWGIVLKFANVKEISASHANGAGTYRLVTAGGAAFTGYANLDGVEVTATLATLPAVVNVDWRASSGSFSYDGGAAMTANTVAVRYKGLNGAYGRFDAANLPARMSVTYTTGRDATLTYDASGVLATLSAEVSKGTGQAAFVLDVANLPPWLNVQAVGDLALLNARSGPTAADGSAEVGTVTFKYASDGQYLATTPATDHVAYVRDNAVTRIAYKDTGLRYFKADVSNNKLSGKVVYTASRPFTASIDTPTATGSVTLTNAPTSMTLDVIPGNLTYTASGPVGTFSLRFDNKDGVSNGLSVSLDVTNLPATVYASWDRASATATLVASAPTTFQGMIRTNGVGAGSSTTDHVYATRTAAGFGVDFKVAGFVRASASFQNGGTYAFISSPGGQPFQAQATLEDATAQLDLSALPTSVTVDLRSGTRTFSWSGTAGSTTKAQYRHNNGQEVVIDLSAMPSTMTLNWGTTSPSQVITYTASGTLTRAYVLYRQATGGMAFEATLDNLPLWAELSVGQDSASFDARSGAGGSPGSASLGGLVFKYASDGQFIQTVPAEDHLVVSRVGSTLRAALKDTGAKLVKGSVANNEIHAEAAYVNPRPFSLNVDTPTAIVTATISAVPQDVKVDLVGSTLTYAATSTVPSVRVTWDNRDGTTNGLGFDVTVTNLPATATVSWDKSAPSFTLTAASPFDVTGNVRVNGGSVGALATDHVNVRRSAGTTALGVSFRLTGVKSLSASFANGGAYSGAFTPGGQALTVSDDVDGAITGTLSIGAMPTSFNVNLNPTARVIEYVGIASGTTISADYKNSNSGMEAKGVLTGVPANAKLEWTTGPSSTLTYTASGPMTSATAAYRQGFGAVTVFDMTLGTLPAYLKATLAADTVELDTRSSPTAAAGSGMLGSIWLRYASNGAFLANTPVEEHILLTQTGTPPATTQVEFKDTQLKYARADVVGDQVHATLRNAVPRVMVLGLDTATALATLRVSEVPTEVKVDYAPGTLTWTSTPSPRLDIDSITLRFDSRSGTVVNVDVTDLPATATATWDTTANKVTFTGSSAVGLIKGRIVVGNGNVETATGDHLMLLKSGSQWAADFQVSGLKRLHVDPTNGGRYEVDFFPGGQAFTAKVQPDADQTLTLSLGAMPTNAIVDLKPGSKTYSYSGAPVGSKVTATYAKTSSGQSAQVDATGLPASAGLTWTTGNTGPTFTYTATNRLTSLSVKYKESTSGGSYDCAAGDLPTWMRLNLASDAFTFDTRTSETAATGSSYLGSIDCKYGSAGAFIVPSATVALNDHVLLKQTSSVTQGNVKASGVKYASLNTANDQLAADLRLQSSRFMSYGAETPTSIVTGTVDPVPTWVTVNWDGSTLKYRAGGTITKATFWIDPGSQLITSVELNGIPTEVDVKVDFVAQQATWKTNGALSSGSAYGRRSISGRTWDGNLVVTGVPATLTGQTVGGTVSWSAQRPKVTLTGGSLGTLDVTVTNHAATKRLDGNHFSAVYRSDTGDFDASFRATGVSLLDVQKLANGWQANLNTNGGTYGVNVDFMNAASRAYATGTISSMPTQLEVKFENDVVGYTSNGNAKLDISAEVGNGGGATNAPTPTRVNGFVVRDGHGCVGSTCGVGYKVKVYLEGAPKAFTFNGQARSVSATEFRPPTSLNYIVLDAELDNVVTPLMDLYAVLNGIPYGASVTASVEETGTATTSGTPASPGTPSTGCTASTGSSTTGATHGSTKTTKANVDATMALGNFWATISQAGCHGYVSVSNVPATVGATKSLVLTVTTGSSTNSANIKSSGTISSVYVGVKRFATDTTFGGGLYLTDLPTDMTFTYARKEYVSGGQTNEVPEFSYTANADTLDVTLWVDVALFGGDLTAFGKFYATNIARDLKATWDNTNRVYTMSSATGRTTQSVEAHVWARYVWDRSITGCFPTGCTNWLRVEATGRAYLNPASVEDLRVRATWVSSATLRPGFVSSVEGSFDSFEFGWTKVSATLGVQVKVDLVADIGCGACRWTRVNIVDWNAQTTLNLNVDFHVAKNAYGGWYHWDSPNFYCGGFADWDVHVDIKPAPHAVSRNGFTLSRPDSTNGYGWVITPNIGGWAPNFAVEGAAAWLSPLGGGVSAYTQCH